jgi:hypothetical protein
VNGPILYHLVPFCHPSLLTGSVDHVDMSTSESVVVDIRNTHGALLVGFAVSTVCVFLVLFDHFAGFANSQPFWWGTNSNVSGDIFSPDNPGCWSTYSTNWGHSDGITSGNVFGLSYLLTRRRPALGATAVKIERRSKD